MFADQMNSSLSGKMSGQDFQFVLLLVLEQIRLKGGGGGGGDVVTY